MFRCLTLIQPWASLVIAGHKDVENRPRPTSYRGLLLIHAGLKIDDDACERYADLLPCPADDLPAGAILGAVTLTDCVPWTVRPRAVRGPLDPTAIC